MRIPSVTRIIQTLTHGVVALVLLGTASGAEPSPATPETTVTKHGPPVLLKLDDLGWQGRGPNDSVSPRWQKVTEYLEGRNLKASYGIICESLADDRPGYIAWLKERQTKGLIEFWNHGYVNRFVEDKAAGKVGQFVGTTADEQRASLTKGQQLFHDKLGADMRAFGPHSTAVDATTYAVLETIPEITMVWFYGPPAGVKTSKFVFERKINIEVPLFVPNPADVRTRYEKYGHDLPYIALQGHPNQWDDQRFTDFTTIVQYLVDQGCSFTTPSEFLATQKKPATP
jgi:hypothetical protein